MPPTAPLSDLSMNLQALLDEAAQGLAADAAPAPASGAATMVPSITLGAAANSSPPHTFGASDFLGGADGPPAPWELPPREADLYWPVLRPLPAPPARSMRSSNTQPAGRETGHSQRPAPFGGPDPRDSVLFEPRQQGLDGGRRDAAEDAAASFFTLPPASLPAWALSPHAGAPSMGADLAVLGDLVTPTPAPSLLRWLSADLFALRENEGGSTALPSPNDGAVSVHYLGGDRLPTEPIGPLLQQPGEGPWRPSNVWDDNSPPLSFRGPWRGGEQPYAGLGGLRGHLPPRLRTAPPYETLTPTRLTPAQAAEAECCLSLEPLAALVQPVAVRAGQAVHLFEYTWLMRHWVRPGQQTNPTNRQPLGTAGMLRVLTDGGEQGA